MVALLLAALLFDQASFAAAPAATNDTLTVGNEDTLRTINASTLLANDTGDGIKITSVTSPSGFGAPVTLSANGLTITYDPRNVTLIQRLRAGFQFIADETFSYTVTDTNGLSDTATVSFTLEGRNDAPTITGSITNSIDDNAAASLFAHITVGDVDDLGPPPDTITATVRLSNFQGSLNNFGQFQGHEGQTEFNLTGSASEVTTALRALRFIPVPNRRPPRQTETFDVTLNVVDNSGAAAAQNGTTRVTVNSINDPATLTQFYAPVTDDNRETTPFLWVEINDPDTDRDTQTYTIQLIQNTTYGTFDPTTIFTAGCVITQTLCGTKAQLEGQELDRVRFMPWENLVTSYVWPGNFVNIGTMVLVDSQSSTSSLGVGVFIVGTNDTPNIAGIPVNILRKNDDETIKPFEKVLISDVDESGRQQVTVSISFPVAAGSAPLGTFPVGNGLSLAMQTNTQGQVTVVYTLTSRTPTNAQTFLRDLVFTPAQNVIPVNETRTLTFTLTVVDRIGATRVNNRTQLAITSINGAPRITTNPNLAQPFPVSPTAPIRPFEPVTNMGVGIEDDDTNVTVTISLDNPGKGTLTGGFTQVSPGVYRRVGTPADLTTNIQSLIFEVNDSFLFPPDAPGGTAFTITAEDSVLNASSRTLAIFLQEAPRNWLVTEAEDNLLPGSLRYTLQKIDENKENNATITFALPAYPATIRLEETTGPIVLDRNVTFKGPGADMLSISGDSDGNGTPDVPLFRVHATVIMEGLTLTQGSATEGIELTGGAVYVGPAGHLTMRYCVVAHSRAAQWGGGIDVDEGSLHMSHCLVRGNSTHESLGLGGGGISLYTTEICSFINTTFSGNRQRSANGVGGGALYVENLNPMLLLPVEVTHCTFDDNTDGAGGGTSLHANVFGAMVQVRNSIFADGLTRNLEISGAAEIFSAGGNISDDATRTVLTQNGQPKDVILLDHSTDRRQTNPRLRPLNNARPTPMHTLLRGSPAIGLAVGPAEGTDQSGSIRDNDPDSGAAELNPSQRVVINEIHFDPDTAAGQSDFLELYALRDSRPVDLGGYMLLVNGRTSHVFAANTVVQPGFGIIVAQTIFSLSPSNNPTPVTNAPSLSLESRGLIELKQPGVNPPILRVDYTGLFADPNAPTQTLNYAHNSLTLAPQFRGFAYLPHSMVLPPPLGGADPDLGRTVNPISPGKDSGNTPFGSPNAFPVAVDDEVLVDEDQLFTIGVLDNDIDADGSDQLVVVDVSQNSAPGVGNNAVALSEKGATNTVDPDATPLKGSAIIYDPRSATNLQMLAEGAKTTDTFWYETIDYGSGEITEYSAHPVPGNTIVVSPGHRMTNDTVIISGSSVSNYNREFIVTRLNGDRFSIPVAFAGAPETNGSWVTKNPRFPTQRSEGKVTVTVLGANDPPAPAPDLITNVTEETIVRIMADPNLTPAVRGSVTTFDTDALFPAPRQISNVSLLINDRDPDTDDDATTLHVVGIVGSVNTIDGYTGTPGSDPVTVVSTNHGLTDGALILISGYGGYRSYNGFHVVSVIDSNSFSIPVLFVDDHPATGVWTILNDANRLSATSKHGAAVKLEIRADRIETSIVYNPRTSTHLNGLALGEVDNDEFYYAVQDRHGAITVASVTVEVTGVNDLPQPTADPASIALLNLLTGSGSPSALAQVVTQLTAFYYLPPGSGTPNRTDLQAQFSNATTVADLFLEDLWTTDEDTPLDLSSTDLLANDTDVDRTDVLTILLPSTTSREGAGLSLSSTGITYNPTISSNLNSLAREELLLDTFEITITDSRGGQVNSLVTVLVVGANDTPIAQDDNSDTPEDVPLTLNPILHPTNDVSQHDRDFDINGRSPDNRLVLVPTNGMTTVGAHVTILGGISYTNPAFNLLSYDPRPSAFLDGLSRTQTYVDTFEYIAMDGSFVFANDDLFKVEADGSGFVLNVLSNDRNLTRSGDSLSPPLRIVALGTPRWHGTATIDPSGANIIYTPQINFVGDDFFTYIVSDENGNTDSALITVRVTVNQLNGNLQANHDSFTVARGESPLLDVLANDNIIPAGGDSLIVTRILSSPDRGGAVALVNNQILYTPDAAFAGAYPYTEAFLYEIKADAPTPPATARATALVQVVVVDRRGALNIRDDSFSVQTGSRGNALDVLFNDNLLPGSGALQPLTILSVNSASHGEVTSNEQNTGLVYTPDEGYIGEDTFTYAATDGLGGTGTGVVTVVVGSLTTSIDFFVVPFDSTNTVADNGFTTLNVLANDLVLLAATGSVVIASVTPTNTFLGDMAVSSDGKLLEFNPAEGVQGEQEFTYTIRDASGRTADGKVIVLVIEEGVRANSDAFSVEVSSSANPLDVLANDRAIPDRGRRLAVVSVGAGVDAPNRGGTVAINESNDGLIYTPAPGFSGEETFTYTMTDSRKSDTARVIVRVTSGELSANQDAFTVFFEPNTNGSSLNQFTLSVLANDRVLPDFGQLITITGVGIDDSNASNAPDRQGSVTISDDGTSLIYVPGDEDGPFPYVERFTYEITDGTARRAQAVVTIEVQKRINARELETNDDAYTVATDSANNVLNVLANDAIKPAGTAGWVITGITAVASNGIATISGSAILYTPLPGFIGTDHLTYAVSDGFGGTGSGVVTIKVGDLPLCPDVFVALGGASSTSPNVFDVLANDAILHSTAEDYLLLDAGSTDRNGTVWVDNGLVLYTPDPNYTNGYPYTETFLYRVQDDSFGTVTGRVAVTVYEFDSDRDRAILSITVHGVNDAPTISGAATNNITDKDTVQPFATMVIGDVDDQGQELLTVTVVIDDPIKGQLLNLGGFAEGPAGTFKITGTPAAITSAIRGLTYDPTENRITVPTSEPTRFTVMADDLLVVVTNAETVVNVTAVNDPPIISGTIAGQTVYYKLTIRPFAQVTITEVDDLTLQRLTVRVAFDGSHGFLTSLGGFVSTGSGSYALSNITAAAASTALRGLIFVPTTGNRVAPGGSETTQFTISVNDGFAPTISDNITTVIARHGFTKKLLASDRSSEDEFGYAVATTRDWMAVGVPFDDPNGSSSGSVYLFARNQGGADNWGQVLKIVAPDSAAGDRFGYSVDLYGDTLVVGAPRDSHLGTSSGSAYVFERNQPAPDQWGFVRKLLSSDRASGDDFGHSITIHLDTIIVGAPQDNHSGESDAGSAYVFQRNEGGLNNWGQIRKLIASDPDDDDDFGFSVAIDADTLIVGARRDNDRGTDSGSAYIFERNQGGANNWGQLRKLLAADGDNEDHFGQDVGISGDLIVIGAPSHSADDEPGAAYVFARHQGGTNAWGQARKIVPFDGQNDDEFGYSVAIDRETIVIGSRNDDHNGTDSGSAYVYVRNHPGLAQWSLVEKIVPPDAADDDEFGYDVSISGATVAIGAPRDDDGGSAAGSTYVYRLKFNNPPVVVTPIADQSAEQGVLFTLTIPANTFDDADPDDVLSLSVVAVGSPFASVSFDPVTRTISGVPIASGIFQVHVTATDLDGAAVTDIFDLNIAPGAPAPIPAFESWRIQHFGSDNLNDASLEDLIWGLNADPDGDGLDNLREYLFACDPNLATDAAATGLHMQRDASGLSITFRRRIDDPRLTYIVEASSDLVNWADAPSLAERVSTVPIDGHCESVVLEISPSASVLFCRIKVQY